MLTVLVGAPIAALACQRYRRHEYAGRIVGGNKSFGHRVLDASLDVGGANTEEVEIAIVGSGVAGLSAAWRLERQGEPRYVVLELESQSGGTSCYATDGIVPYPWAAHYLPVPDSSNVELTALLKEIGGFDPDKNGQLEPAENMLVRAPDERLYVDGRWISGLLPRSRMLPADWAEFARFQGQVRQWVAFRDDHGRRAFALPLSNCSPESPWVKSDSMSAAAWLRAENYRSKLLRWWLEYGCRDDYGCNLDTTSAWALMHYHSARVPNPGAPSAPFLTWPEGNGRLVRHFERVIGTRMRHHQLVVKVTPAEQHVDLTVLQSNGNAPYRLRARHVILAVPRFIAAHLLSSWPTGALERSESFTYVPWMVANLHLKERPYSEQFPLAWDNVLLDSPSLGYVVATHQTLRDEGPTILTYYFPFTEVEPQTARSRLAALDHSECCDVIMSDLVRAHPDLPDLVERIDIWRWGHAMIRPIPGLIWGTDRSEARKSRGRVHFANTDLSGVALFEEAHAHGIRAADAILEERRTVPSVGY